MKIASFLASQTLRLPTRSTQPLLGLFSLLTMLAFSGWQSTAQATTIAYFNQSGDTTELTNMNGDVRPPTTRENEPAPPNAWGVTPPVLFQQGIVGAKVSESNFQIASRPMPSSNSFVSTSDSSFSGVRATFQPNANPGGGPDITLTPEPETWAMMGLGLIALAIFQWRRKRAPQVSTLPHGIAF